jgi:hypothetical protein
VDELALDMASKAKLDADPAFQSWLISLTKFASRDLELVIEKIWHQRWWRDPVTKKDSETDIFLVFQDRSNLERVALHIENKNLKGIWTLSQAENYEKRARARMATYNYSDFQTVLIAPQAFLDAWPHQVAQFNIVISHEALAKFVPEFSVGDQLQ